MKSVLLESSALIEAARKRGRADIRARVKAAMVSGAARLCEPVMLELMNGARGEAERKYLRDLQASLTGVKCTEEAWQRSIDYSEELRKKGKTVDFVDILIFAIAVENDCDILTLDKDFTILSKYLDS